MLAAVLLLAMKAASPPRNDCEGRRVAICPRGRTGPTCELSCGQEPCDYSLYCHSWGGTSGLSVFGTTLFVLDPTWPAWMSAAATKLFVARHPASVGLREGLVFEHLGLAPSHAFRIPAGADEGCACSNEGSSRDRGAWAVLGLAALGLRRRRRGRALGGIALVALCACGDASTSGDASSGDPTGAPIDERFFGAFHSEHAVVGYVQAPAPDGQRLFFWTIVDLRRDGTVTFENRTCDSVESRTLQWTYDPDSQGIELSPNQGTRIIPRDEAYAQVHFRLGPCGELVGTYTPSSGGGEETRRFPRGRVCLDGVDCAFEIVWCDAEPQPVSCP